MERQRQRPTERHRQRDTQRQRDRERWRERQRQRDRDIHTQRHREHPLHCPPGCPAVQHSQGLTCVWQVMEATLQPLQPRSWPLPRGVLAGSLGNKVAALADRGPLDLTSQGAARAAAQRPHLGLWGLQGPGRAQRADPSPRLHPQPALPASRSFSGEGRACERAKGS